MGRPKGLDPAPVLALQSGRSNGDFAADLGVSRRTLQRWSKGYMLSAVVADRTAIRLGRHPANLWGEWGDVPRG